MFHRYDKEQLGGRKVRQRNDGFNRSHSSSIPNGVIANMVQSKEVGHSYGAKQIEVKKILFGGDEQWLFLLVLEILSHQGFKDVEIAYKRAFPKNFVVGTRKVSP